MKTSQPNHAAYLRKEEEAKLLGISQRCLENWMKSKKVPFMKVGKVVLFNHDRVMAALSKYEIKEVA